MIDAGSGSRGGQWAACLNWQQFFLFPWLQDDSLETWPDTVAGQLECFIFASYSQSTIEPLLLAIRALTGVLMARGPVVRGRGQLPSNQSAGERRRRRGQNHKELNSIPGGWGELRPGGCWVGKLDRGQRSGVGPEGLPEHPPFPGSLRLTRLWTWLELISP